VIVQLLDIEWLLSTLFDASLLTFEPPATAAPFFLVPCRCLRTSAPEADDPRVFMVNTKCRYG